ncbi:MAG: glycerophosphodiester phosphodiesterase family protein, partial [Actinomycetota bacterium]|nr:glycerophosphodiester phosphodiesterase family protein [Actinomycetota bacterium]
MPTLPENSLAAVERAGRSGFVIELDVKLSKDRRPVVMHDDLLDRTTTCTGTVGSKTLVQLRECRLDVLGTETKTAPAPLPHERIPRLEEALEVARTTNARVNLEIKNLPIDSDYQPGSAYADDVLEVVQAARLPSRLLLIQS